MKKTIYLFVMAALCINITTEVYSQNTPRPLKNQVIIGKVISATTGESLPGAVIKVTTTNQTMVSNEKGEFIISLSNGIYDLSIYYLNYKTKNISIQIPLKDQLVIALDTDDNNLKEVEINAGYYTVKDKERTGSISRVSSETIAKQPINNPLQAIQGRRTGVHIQQTTGNAGGSYKISIRGQNSLRADGNAPLYIIDGVPFPSTSLGVALSNAIGAGDPLSSLNPGDIECIDILKDADGTAIYGSRGANGVVLITTKKGKSGDTRFDLNVYHGMAKVPNFVELLNTEQYLEMRKEAFKNDNKTLGTTDYDLNGAWDQSRYTDWQKELIGGTAHTTDIQLSLSGGDNQNSYLFKVGKHRETTVLPGNLADNKYSALLNLNLSSLNKKFKADISASYLKDDNNLSLYDPTPYSLSLPPNAPAAFDADGNLNWHNGTFANPYANLRTSYTGQTKTLITNTILSYQVLPELSFKTSLGYTELNIDQKNSTPISANNPAQNIKTGLSSFASNKINTWIIEPQLAYKKSFGKGNLTALLGSTFQQNRTVAELLQATYANDSMLGIIKAASSLNATNSARSLYKYNALFGRVNYTYDGKYILNLTGRRDGSSRFGPNKQFANFGAIGAAWIFSNEAFITNNLSFLSFGKLRSSYGISGSDQIGDYGFYDLWTTPLYAYGSSKGLYPTKLYNPEFAWERNTKFETELTLGLLNDRINTSFSYYKNRSGNQLVGFPTPLTTGFASLQSNLAAVIQNTGIELELNAEVIKTKSFKWAASFNLSIPNNKLISFPGIENTEYRITKQVGQSIYIERSYKYTGIDISRGVYTFEDVNRDGILISSFDYQSLVTRAQKYFGGFQNTFNYKRFDLTVFLQFTKQMGTNYLSNFVSPGMMSNQSVAVLDRWQKTGDTNSIQQYSQTTSAASTAYRDYLNSDQKLTDASYLRLKNVALSYSLPPILLSKVNIKMARIYFQGQNLLTFTDYIGLDPESQNAAALPPLRTLTLGLQLVL